MKTLVNSTARNPHRMSYLITGENLYSERYDIRHTTVSRNASSQSYQESVIEWRYRNANTSSFSIGNFFALLLLSEISRNFESFHVSSDS